MKLQLLTGSSLIENLGWTLIHSVWQIALVALVLFLTLRILVNISANARYTVSVAALAGAVILPGITFYQLTAASQQQIAVDKAFQEQLVGADRAAVDRVRPLRSAYSDVIGNAGAGGIDLTSRIAGAQRIIETYLPVFLPFAVWLWLAGIAFYALRMIGGLWQLRAFRRSHNTIVDGQLQAKFEALCERLQIRRMVRLFISGVIETPIAIGWLRPLIIVPASAILQIDPRGLETVIAHELIHVRRHDTLINILQNAVEVVFFYHPGVRWISSRIRLEREFAADAAVLEMFADSRVVYAKALADLEEIRRSTKIQTSALAPAANGGNLMQRIQKILQKNTGTSSELSAWSAGLALLLIPAVLLALFSVNSPGFVNAEIKPSERKLAIGFVSIPPIDRSENPPKDAFSTAQILMEKLKAHKVPAIGFVTGNSVSDGEKIFPVRAEIVKMWRAEGFEVGLGNFKHVWFHNTPFDEYISGVEKNELAVQKILGEKTKLRFFSYPYLNTGKSIEERDRFESWLSGKGLSSVKYTIDNNEWMYSYAYDTARNDNDLKTMKEVRTGFVRYMGEMFDHFEAYSQEMFRRDIAQTMVLTPSRLVADSADELFGMIERRGYSFVTMAEAQSDEAYELPENYVGNSGISWFERWTITKNGRLRPEPKVDDSVERTWIERKVSK